MLCKWIEPYVNGLCSGVTLHALVLSLFSLFNHLPCAVIVSRRSSAFFMRGRCRFVLEPRPWTTGNFHGPTPTAYLALPISDAFTPIPWIRLTSFLFQVTTTCVQSCGLISTDDPCRTIRRIIHQDKTAFEGKFIINHDDSFPATPARENFEILKPHLHYMLTERGESKTGKVAHRSWECGRKSRRRRQELSLQMETQCTLNDRSFNCIRSSLIKWRPLLSH